MSWEFLLTALIVVVSPGTGVLYTLATGLSRGAGASAVAAFGCTLGIVPHMAAAILGLAALLHTSALAFQTLKYAGVAYLLYMAWMTLKESGALSVEKQPGRSSWQVPARSPPDVPTCSSRSARRSSSTPRPRCPRSRCATAPGS